MGIRGIGILSVTLIVIVLIAIVLRGRCDRLEAYPTKLLFDHSPLHGIAHEGNSGMNRGDLVAETGHHRDHAGLTGCPDKAVVFNRRNAEIIGLIDRSLRDVARCAIRKDRSGRQLQRLVFRQDLFLRRQFEAYQLRVIGSWFW